MYNSVFESFDFERMKLSYTWEGEPFPDTNRLWNDWFEHLKSKGYPIEKRSKHVFIVNHHNKTGICFRFAHYSKNKTNSTRTFGSRRKGAHNLKAANQWIDTYKVSGYLDQAFSAMTVFLAHYKAYRLGLILRTDVHVCSLFIKKNRNNGRYKMVLFNTLNKRFHHFDCFHSGLKNKALSCYTKPGSENLEKCDILSFQEMEHFFEVEKKLAYPFCLSMVEEYKPRKVKKENVN